VVRVGGIHRRRILRATTEGDATKEYLRASRHTSAARRVAAIFALISLAAAVLSAVEGVRGGSLWRLLVAVASVLGGVVGLWYAVSRRGAVRVVGLSVALVGVALAAIVTLTSSQLAWWGLVTILLIGVSGLAAGYALGRDAPTVDVGYPVVWKVTKPTAPVLILNPRSGGGKVERFGLVDGCRRLGIEPLVLEPGEDLLGLAKDAISRGADVIGMAGGDGSQALVASVAMEHDVPFVCVPAGTLNHFASDLGLDRHDVAGALEAFEDGVERRVDLGRVNGRIFVNSVSMGLYARIVQSVEYRDAKMKTAADILPSLIGPSAEPFDLRFAGPDSTTYPSAHLLLVSNDVYQMDSLGRGGTRERMDTGTLGIMAARIPDAREVATFLSLEAAGRIRSFTGWLEWEANRFEVRSGAPVEMGIDGEALTMDPPLTFESLPLALRVRLPRNAPCFSPAARLVPVSPPTVRRLLRLSVGRPAR
jgi:diacylglycerol kinase family enzyme